MAFFLIARLSPLLVGYWPLPDYAITFASITILLPRLIDFIFIFISHYMDIFTRYHAHFHYFHWFTYIQAAIFILVMAAMIVIDCHWHCITPIATHIIDTQADWYWLNILRYAAIDIFAAMLIRWLSHYAMHMAAAISHRDIDITILLSPWYCRYQLDILISHATHTPLTIGQDRYVINIVAYSCHY